MVRNTTPHQDPHDQGEEEKKGEFSPGEKEGASTLRFPGVARRKGCVVFFS
jgi:hypothetical protein